MIEKMSLAVNNPALSEALERKTAAELADSFGQYLNDAVDKLNAQQAEADRLSVQFVKGELSDLHQLMIAGQKSSLGLELTVQIRNKVIEAYQEIMRTQI